MVRAANMVLVKVWVWVLPTHVHDQHSSFKDDNCPLKNQRQKKIALPDDVNFHCSKSFANFVYEIGESGQVW
jgi:hypothetical protein